MAAHDPFKTNTTYSTAPKQREDLRRLDEIFPPVKKRRYKKIGDMVRDLETGAMIPYRKLSRKEKKWVDQQNMNSSKFI